MYIYISDFTLDFVYISTKLRNAKDVALSVKQ